jgi:hypothetical protein
MNSLRCTSNLLSKQQLRSIANNKKLFLSTSACLNCTLKRWFQRHSIINQTNNFNDKLIANKPQSSYSSILKADYSNNVKISQETKPAAKSKSRSYNFPTLSLYSQQENPLFHPLLASNEFEAELLALKRRALQATDEIVQENLNKTLESDKTLQKFLDKSQMSSYNLDELLEQSNNINIWNQILYGDMSNTENELTTLAEGFQWLLAIKSQQIAPNAITYLIILLRSNLKISELNQLQSILNAHQVNNIQLPIETINLLLLADLLHNNSLKNNVISTENHQFRMKIVDHIAEAGIKLGDFTKILLCYALPDDIIVQKIVVEYSSQLKSLNSDQINALLYVIAQAPQLQEHKQLYSALLSSNPTKTQFTYDLLVTIEAKLTNFGRVRELYSAAKAAGGAFMANLTTIQHIISSAAATNDFHLLFQVLGDCQRHKIQLNLSIYAIIISLFAKQTRVERIKEYFGKFLSLYRDCEGQSNPEHRQLATETCNFVLISYGKALRFEEINEILAEMDKFNIPRDENTFIALGTVYFNANEQGNLMNLYYSVRKSWELGEISRIPCEIYEILFSFFTGSEGRAAHSEVIRIFKQDFQELVQKKLICPASASVYVGILCVAGYLATEKPLIRSIIDSLSMREPVLLISEAEFSLISRVLIQQKLFSSLEQWLQAGKSRFALEISSDLANSVLNYCAQAVKHSKNSENKEEIVSFRQLYALLQFFSSQLALDSNESTYNIVAECAENSQQIESLLESMEKLQIPLTKPIIKQYFALLMQEKQWKALENFYESLKSSGFQVDLDLFELLLTRCSGYGHLSMFLYFLAELRAELEHHLDNLYRVRHFFPTNHRTYYAAAHLFHSLEQQFSVDSNLKFNLATYFPVITLKNGQNSKFPRDLPPSVPLVLEESIKSVRIQAMFHINTVDFLSNRLQQAFSQLSQQFPSENEEEIMKKLLRDELAVEFQEKKSNLAPDQRLVGTVNAQGKLEWSVQGGFKEDDNVAAILDRRFKEIYDKEIKHNTV